VLVNNRDINVKYRISIFFFVVKIQNEFDWGHFRLSVVGERRRRQTGWAVRGLPLVASARRPV
jgi:hypothetical protein